MTGYFDEETVEALYAGREAMRQQFDDLRGRFLARLYNSERGREFAFHGFCRRLIIMVRGVDIVFNRLPPELEEIPSRDSVVEATVAIQSFVLNAYGCLDNLAWIWVCERPVLKANGEELEPFKVGFGPKSKVVRASLSSEFVAYLESRQEWVDYLKGFRDSLAHRIPLYIPPFIVPPDVSDEYNRLEKASADALRKKDSELWDKAQATQQSLGQWRPWMTHSINESSPHVVFHSQLIQDCLTIAEFGRELLGELER